MANYDIRQLQLRILDTLTMIDQVCKKHNLRYYIMAGTLLGAIRHNGFIPWDDDIDIGMPRSDYEQLIKYSKEWLPQPYEFVCAENDQKYPLPFGKIQNASTTLIERIGLKYLGGIYIDVFPLDGVPQNFIKQKMHFAAYEYHKRILYLTHRDPYKHGKGPSSWIPLLCRKLFNIIRIQKKIRTLLMKYSFDKCQLVADYDDGSKGVMKKEILGNPTPITFEGVEVLGVENYDAYLSQKYGGYMDIPPKEKQKIHNFYYVDFHTPYNQYSRMEKK